MATVAASARIDSASASRWTILLAYLAAVIVAETFVAIPGGSFQSIGLGLHILLIFTLMFLSVLLQSRDATLAALVVAASLASLVRVFSLAVPRYPFVAPPETNPLNTLPWLAPVSVPLLVSVAPAASVQEIGRAHV